jgi:hypothetical protein
LLSLPSSGCKWPNHFKTEVRSIRFE